MESIKTLPVNIPSPSGKTCSGLSTNWAKSQGSLGNLLHLLARFRALVHEGKMTFCINVTPVRTLCIHHLRKSLPLASFPFLSEAWSPFYIIHLFLSWDCSNSIHFLCAPKLRQFFTRSPCILRAHSLYAYPVLSRAPLILPIALCWLTERRGADFDHQFPIQVPHAEWQVPPKSTDIHW